MWGDHYGNMGWYGFGFGWIFMLLFWGLIIWAVIFLVRGGASGKYGGFGRNNSLDGEKRNSAQDILKERYARGEITKDEFEKMKKDVM